MDLRQHIARHPADNLIGDIGGISLPVPLLVADLCEIAACAFHVNSKAAPEPDPVEAHAIGVGVDSGRLVNHALSLGEHDLAHAEVLVNRNIVQAALFVCFADGCRFGCFTRLDRPGRDLDARILLPYRKYERLKR
jgi:hypothetical protein